LASAGGLQRSAPTGRRQLAAAGHEEGIEVDLHGRDWAQEKPSSRRCRCAGREARAKPPAGQGRAAGGIESGVRGKALLLASSAGRPT